MARTSKSPFVTKMEDGTFFYHNETPIGSINSSNVTFTLADTPNPSTTLELTLNGQELSLTEDYTLSGDTITMLYAPDTGSLLKADYRVEPQ